MFGDDPKKGEGPIQTSFKLTQSFNNFFFTTVLKEKIPLVFVMVLLNYFRWIIEHQFFTNYTITGPDVAVGSAFALALDAATP